MRCVTNIAKGVRPSGSDTLYATGVGAQDVRPGRSDTAIGERLAVLRKAVERLLAAPALGKAAGGSTGPEPSQGLRGPFRGLPAALPCGALNELVAAHADRPAAFGFMFALTALGLKARAGPAVFVAARRALAEFGVPYGHGLAQLGVDVGRLMLVDAKTDKDALWALEETLRSGAAATVAGAIAGALDLTSSRRLNLAAAAQRTPLVVLRGTGAAGASAAATRWRIASAPAARDRFGTFRHWRWRVTLERNRNGRPGAWLIEWNHVAHRFRVVEGLADRPPAQSAGLRRAG
jgi:protein ImuA